MNPLVLQQPKKPGANRVKTNVIVFSSGIAKSPKIYCTIVKIVIQSPALATGQKIIDYFLIKDFSM